MSRKGNTMKLISWNIDSLNAALTSDSARAKLSQEVLQPCCWGCGYHCHSRNQVIRQRTYQKTTLKSLRNSSLAMKKPGALLKNRLVKAMLGPCSSIKRAHTSCDFPRDRCSFDHGLGRSDHYTRIWSLFSWLRSTHQTLVMDSNVWKNVKSGMSNMRNTWLN